MKLMRKNWKDRKGVSPVIATILMVAITVVLAAVLYVMVMGFGGDSGSIPTGEFKAAEKMSDGSYRLQVLSISDAKSMTDMKFALNGGTVNEVKIVTDSGYMLGGESTTPSIIFTDLNGDDKVSTGDYFTIKVPAGDYTVALSFAPSSGSGGVICDTSFKAT